MFAFPLKTILVPVERAGVPQMIPIEHVTREELWLLCRRLGQVNVVAEDLLAQLCGFDSLHTDPPHASERTTP